MKTRRRFLAGAAAAAGIAFCGCGLTRPAHAQTGNGQTGHAPLRLPVTVAGKRVKTIDVHCHCLFPEAASLMGAEAAGLVPPILGASDLVIVLDQRLKAMDNIAIDMEVVSINPFWYSKDHDTAEKICTIQNDKLAELCAAHPDRFAAFASLTLQDPALAAQQLETAMKRQGLKGAAIGDQVADDEFSNPRFDPVWAKAEELGAVLFIHPQGVPELNKRWKGNGWLANTIANPLSTTIALEHLIYDGAFDRHPGLKVLAAHGGGYVASYAPRMDHACYVGPSGCDANVHLKKEPTAYLNQIYYDALVFTPEALRHLIAQVGASQIMLGTDCPFPWEVHPADRILETPGLARAEQAAILGGNAQRLFGLSA
jgi:aminocarboxymuconate-semialdehyde decarboxylase